MDALHIGRLAQQACGLSTQRLAPVGIGFDDLHSGASGKVIANRLNGCGKAKACGGGQYRQEHHDRDDPRHGPSDTAFWQQPVARGGSGAAVSAGHDAATPWGLGG
jgi:hypothetical protein